MSVKNEISTASRRVLLVEDDIELAELLGALLSEIFDEVDWVSSGELAKARLKDWKYQLIMCDYKLSGELTGLQLWKDCAKVAPTSHFILLSGFSADVFSALLDTQADCPPFLSKPFQAGQVRNLVYETMGLSAAA